MNWGENGGNSAVIRALWKATFRGRRAELEVGKMDTIDTMLKYGCPLFNQAAFVSFNVCNSSIIEQYVSLLLATFLRHMAS